MELGLAVALMVTADRLGMPDPPRWSLFSIPFICLSCFCICARNQTILGIDNLAFVVCSQTLGAAALNFIGVAVN